jgi:predicted XRE-type DNA-binding protein
MVKSNNQPKESLKKLSYQYPPRDKEILAKMKHPDYEGNFLLPSDATLLDKAKYRICEKILKYKCGNKLTVEKLAERINLSVPETKELLFCHIQKFTLDRLITYFDNLHIPFEIKITNQSEVKHNL